MTGMNDIIAASVQKLYDVSVDVTLTRPDPKFGDFATNVALQLAGKVGKNPRDIAEELANELNTTGSFSQVEVAGPGFINLRLSDSVLLADALRQPARQDEGRSFVIEYSCPNAFKELHTGHLYQTIAGDILARLVEQSGANVHRTSFGGDVGLHVAKCVWGMVAELGGILPEKLDEVEASAFGRARWITQCYVRGAGE